MNRITKILVLLAVMSVFAVSVTAVDVYAGEDVIDLPSHDVKSGELEAGLNGAPLEDEGDPDGMDDTNDDPSMLAPSGMSAVEWEQYLLLIMTQLHFMGL
ncbi:MAG: hypothetical protein ACI9UK_002322 [Candidatus Krumholzibacteriia bacterium]|jgi:hypothetical protein